MLSLRVSVSNHRHGWAEPDLGQYLMHDPKGLSFRSSVLANCARLPCGCGISKPESLEAAREDHPTGREG